MAACTSSKRYDIHRSIGYDRDLRVTNIWYGDDWTDRNESKLTHVYDDRRRNFRIRLLRDPSGSGADLDGVTTLDQRYLFDAADNMTRAYDVRPYGEWPAGALPERVDIDHDALYRVVAADYLYKDASGWQATDAATDWRAERSTHMSSDPMRENPAAMLPAMPSSRVGNLTYEYDWLANMVEWTDDEPAFYERSLGPAGQIVNGFDESQRPSALYLSSNLPTSAPSYSATIDRGGWLEVDYGVSGNVQMLTVHAQCVDLDSMNTCWDDTTDCRPRRCGARAAPDTRDSRG